MNGTSTIKFGHCPVTGAAGYTRSHLVRALLEQGYRVRTALQSWGWL